MTKPLLLLLRLIIKPFNAMGTLWASLHYSPQAYHNDSISDAIAEAMRRFPNDPNVVRAKAMSELEMRRLFGQRTHDA